MESSDHRRAFRESGYCIMERAVPEAELAGLRDAAEALLTEDPTDRGPRFHDIDRGDDRRFLAHRHADFPAVERFVFSDRMRGIAKGLLDDGPFLFNEQFVVKGPRTGASFAWHQDGFYVGFEHRPYVTVWVALDDTTAQNGCLYVLPRNLDRDMALVPHVWDATGKEYVGYDGPEAGVEVTCPAGTIVAFSSTTLHRSGENRTDRRRRAYICQYSPEPIIDPKTGAPKNYAKPLMAA